MAFFGECWTNSASCGHQADQSEIEAIYNSLPDHLHVPWSIKAVEAGKHVLGEKPLSMTVAEAKTLLAAQKRAGVKMGEAFMVRTTRSGCVHASLRSLQANSIRSAYRFAPRPPPSRAASLLTPQHSPHP